MRFVVWQNGKRNRGDSSLLKDLSTRLEACSDVIDGRTGFRRDRERVEASVRDSGVIVVVVVVVVVE